MTIQEFTRGSSGAQFIVDDDNDQVTKLDTERTGRRVHEQGRWLWSYNGDNIPTVSRVLPNGYVMERLESINYNVADTMTYIALAWYALDSACESVERRGGAKINAPFVAPDRDALHYYVKKLAADVQVEPTLNNLITCIEWPTTLCWTHGDPIIDNLMTRKRANGVLQYVLIDAIPPTPALPSLAVVDYGRLVQSAAGYEQLRYLNADVSDWQANVTRVLDWVVNKSYDRGFDPNAVRATLFYSVIHMLRGARTAPEAGQMDRIINRARDLEALLLEWI